MKALGKTANGMNMKQRVGGSIATTGARVEWRGEQRLWLGGRQRVVAGVWKDAEVECG